MRKILIVEDEIALQKATRIGLANHGFESVSVVSVEEAMGLLEAGNHFDGLWLDHYLLGEKTGLDLLSQLRQSKVWGKMPVFVVTNSVGDDKINGYTVLGVEKYFVKAESKLGDIINDINLYFDKKTKEKDAC